MADRRDFYGYGPRPPHPHWPGEAKVAVSLVLNIEAGAELSIADGDEANESVYEIVQPLDNAPHLALESHFEFGHRVGLWRILDLFDHYGVKVTLNVAARALERSPWIGQEALRRGHEICCHGYRWEHLAYKSEAEERAALATAVQVIQTITGTPPLGWHTKAPSTLRTRRLLQEQGCFLYDSDAYNDELPYTILVNERPHIVLPYSFDTNDMRFTGSETFRLAQDFSTYLIDSFNWLWHEGSRTPKMMTVGLHPRIIGRPGRMGALQTFLEHLKHTEGVWIARRDEIARHWQQRTAAGDIPFLPIPPETR